MDKSLIQKWFDEGLINTDQAERMLADVLEAKRDSRSSKFIIAVSTIGAILLGVAAVLFIASNWQELSNFTKMAMLVGATGAAYVAGYGLRYRNEELPRVGMALLLLAALLFGATIILTAQIYHVNANDHGLVAVWLIGVIPLVFATRSVAVAVLAAVLYFTWVYLFAYEQRHLDYGVKWPMPFTLSSMILFGIGGLLTRWPDMGEVGRALRLVSLKVFMTMLFVFTFEYFSVWDAGTLERSRDAPLTTWVFFGLALILQLLHWALQKHQPDAWLEVAVGGGLVVVLAAFQAFPSTGQDWLLTFNLLFAGLCLLFIWLGYRRGDIRVVNMGLFWTGAFLLARYFDWFWDLMDRALFFLVGGVILVVGGIVLEKQRRRIKAGFASE